MHLLRLSFCMVAFIERWYKSLYEAFLNALLIHEVEASTSRCFISKRLRFLIHSSFAPKLIS
jgi:hypothetical protein